MEFCIFDMKRECLYLTIARESVCMQAEAMLPFMKFLLKVVISWLTSCCKWPTDMAGLSGGHQS